MVIGTLAAPLVGGDSNPGGAALDMRKRQSVDVEADADAAARPPDIASAPLPAPAARQAAPARGASCGFVAALLLLAATLFLVLTGFGYFILAARQDYLELGTMQQRARGDSEQLDSARQRVAVLEAQLQSLRERLAAAQGEQALWQSKVDHLTETRADAREQLGSCHEQLRLQVATARSLGAGGRPLLLAGGNNDTGAGGARDVLTCTVNVTGDFEADFRAEHAQVGARKLHAPLDALCTVRCHRRCCGVVAEVSLAAACALGNRSLAARASRRTRALALLRAAA